MNTDRGEDEYRVNVEQQVTATTVFDSALCAANKRFVFYYAVKPPVSHRQRGNVDRARANRLMDDTI